MHPHAHAHTNNINITYHTYSTYNHVTSSIQIQSLNAFQSVDQPTWNTSSVYRNIIVLES